MQHTGTSRGAAGEHDVALAAFHADHLPQLAAWLQAPAVAPWYPVPAADLALAASPPPGAHRALIVFDGQPVGLIRWQFVDRETLDALGLPEVPDNAVDVDILIGEPAALGRGVGPRALDLLARELARDPSVPMLGLTSSPANTRAHRGFLKVGFEFARTYHPDGPEGAEMFLFLRDLRTSRATTPVSPAAS